MPKWVVVTASVLAVVAVIMFVCFRSIGSAHAEPGALQGAGGHKASGHVAIVSDGAVTKLVFKDDFILQDAPAPRLAWGSDGYKRGTTFATLAKFKGAQEYIPFRPVPISASSTSCGSGARSSTCRSPSLSSNEDARHAYAPRHWFRPARFGCPGHWQ